MTYDFAVIIINYKTANMTIQCVESVLPEIAGQNACTVIVDNASADGSVEQLAEWIANKACEDKVRLYASPVNSGFSGGNNSGIKQVEARHYILLNSDTLVRPGAFEVMLSTFTRDTSIGFVSPRLEWDDGEGQQSCFNFHSPISEFINAAHTGFITRLLNRYNVPLPLAEGVSYCQWTSFACIAVRGEVIQDIGLMDDGYFLYFEDADYCRMALQAGWKVIHNPAAHVVHFRGGSAELKHQAKLKKRLPGYFYDSRSYYFKKHYGWVGLIAANLLWSVGRCISKSREILQRKPRTASDLQWLDIWTNRRLFESRD